VKYTYFIAYLMRNTETQLQSMSLFPGNAFVETDKPITTHEQIKELEKQAGDTGGKIVTIITFHLVS
jgi:hypothetical protein